MAQYCHKRSEKKRQNERGLARAYLQREKVKFMKNKFYDINKLEELNSNYTFIIGSRRYGRKYASKLLKNKKDTRD